MCKIPHLSTNKKKEIVHICKSFNCAVCVGGVEMITKIKYGTVNITRLFFRFILLWTFSDSVSKLLKPTE